MSLERTAEGVGALATELALELRELDHRHERHGRPASRSVARTHAGARRRLLAEIDEVLVRTRAIERGRRDAGRERQVRRLVLAIEHLAEGGLRRETFQASTVHEDRGCLSHEEAHP
jgi:hypothetical protein